MLPLRPCELTRDLKADLRKANPLIKSSDPPSPEPTQQDLTQQNIEDPEKPSS